MRKLFKYVFIVAFVLGGWVLSAASLHIVRAPGRMVFNLIPINLQIVPKTNLSFRETWVDTTKWSVADVQRHGTFQDRLNQAGKADLLKEALATPAPVPPPVASATVKPAIDPSLIPAEKPTVAQPPVSTPVTVTPAPPAERKPTSIFDFSNEKKK